MGETVRYCTFDSIIRRGEILGPGIFCIATSMAEHSEISIFIKDIGERVGGDI